MSPRPIQRLTATLLGLLTCACGDHPSVDRTGYAPVDITADYYHRAKSGMFLPDREPVVLQVGERHGPQGVPTSQLVGLELDIGTLWVEPGTNQRVVAYVDVQTFYSHFVVHAPVPYSRDFLEWPTHPFFF